MLFQTLLANASDSGVGGGNAQLITTHSYGASTTKTNPYTLSAAMAYRYALNDLDKYSLFIVTACEWNSLEASNCTQIGEPLLIETQQGMIYYNLYKYTTSGNDIVFTRSELTVESYFSILFLTLENVSSLLIAGSWNETPDITAKTYTYTNTIPKSNKEPLLCLFNFLLVNTDYVCSCLPTGSNMAFDNKALYDNYYGDAGRLQPFIAYGNEGAITLTRTDQSDGVEKYAQCLWYEVVPKS